MRTQAVEFAVEDHAAGEEGQGVDGDVEGRRDVRGEHGRRHESDKREHEHSYPQPADIPTGVVKA